MSPRPFCDGIEMDALKKSTFTGVKFYPGFHQRKQIFAQKSAQTRKSSLCRIYGSEPLGPSDMRRSLRWKRSIEQIALFVEFAMNEWMNEWMN